MFNWHGYPYTNFHELNLDWIIEKVAQNRDSILALENAFNNLNPDSTIGNPGILHVGQESGMYTSINSAINYAKTYCAPEKRVLIIVHGGVYNESIRLLPNPGIDILGLSETVVNCPDAIQYPEAALYTAGSGYFANLTFRTQAGGVYALHYEVQEHENESSGSVCVFDNCAFVGENGRDAIGCGGGANDRLVFNSCNIYSDLNRAIYVHNYPVDGGDNFDFELYNCIIRGRTSFALDYYPNNKMTLRMKNNTMSGTTSILDKSTNTITKYMPTWDKMNNDCKGNTGRALEPKEDSVIALPCVEFGGYLRAVVPVEGLVNNDSIEITKYVEMPFPDPIVKTVKRNFVEFAFNQSSNPGINSLRGQLTIKPQL